MELPEDVLAIVRAYAKPRMRYYKEYKRAMLEMGWTQYDWPIVRKRLCDADGDQVLKALLEYKDCRVVTDYLHRKVELQRTQHRIPCYRELSRQMEKRAALERAFQIRLIGEEAVLDSEDAYD